MKVKSRRRTRKLSVEALEARLVLNAPMPFPGTPIELPQGGPWRNTPFVGSPVLADLDGDGKDEILAAAAGGMLVAYSTGLDGQLREFQRYRTGAESNFKSTPIVIDRPGGSKMIVAGLGRDEFASPSPLEDGRVFAWDAVTGQVLPGWPQQAAANVARGVIGPLAAGDLTGDGQMEIVVTSFDMRVRAFRQDGSLLWTFHNDDTVQSGAAIGDIDRDGRPEVVFGADSSASPYYEAGGFVNILNANGSAKFRIETKEVIWSSPVLADLTGDGFLEIVVGTGLNFSLTDPNAPPDVRAEAKAFANQVLAYDHRGQILPGWPYRTFADGSQNRQVYASPAVADLTGDGMLEVVAVDFAGFVHAIRGNGQPLPGFEGGRRTSPEGVSADTFSSPIIADVNGDGAPEIITAAVQRLLAMDRSGVELWSLTAPRGPDGQPDGQANAPAVGQLDGQGGLELVTVTNVFGVPNPPRGIGVYQLPESPIVPPWPMHRKTPSAQPISYSPQFLDRYVKATFRALLGREASGSDLAYFPALMQSNVWTPKIFAETVALTPEARNVVIRQLYQTFLQRQPTGEELTDGQQLLAVDTAEEFARSLLLSGESIAKTDGSTGAVLNRFYETILKRTLTRRELDILVPVVENGWLSLPQIAQMLFRSEEFVLLEIAAPTIIAYRTEFPDAPFDPAAVATVIMDRQGNRREEQMRAGLIWTGGRYDRSSLAVGLVRSIYGDVLMRDAGPDEVAFWIREFAGGRSGPADFIAGVVNSVEARALNVREQVRSLLGRDTDPGMVASLANIPTREELKVVLLSSDEYFARHGGTNTGFVQAIFRDLYGVDPLPESVLSSQVSVLNQGRQTRAEMILSLMSSDIGREVLITNLLFRYLPAEDKGVLRVPLETPGAPPNNPDPALIQALVSSMRSGATEANVLLSLFTSPLYLDKSAYIRGSYRGLGQRA